MAKTRSQGSVEEPTVTLDNTAQAGVKKTTTTKKSTKTKASSKKERLAQRQIRQEAVEVPTSLFGQPSTSHQSSTTPKIFSDGLAAQEPPKALPQEQWRKTVDKSIRTQVNLRRIIQLKKLLQEDSYDDVAQSIEEAERKLYRARISKDKGIPNASSHSASGTSIFGGSGSEPRLQHGSLFGAPSAISTESVRHALLELLIAPNQFVNSFGIVHDKTSTSNSLFGYLAAEPVIPDYEPARRIGKDRKAAKGLSVERGRAKDGRVLKKYKAKVTAKAKAKDMASQGSEGDRPYY